MKYRLYASGITGVCQQAVDWFSYGTLTTSEYERSMDDCIHNNNSRPMVPGLDEKMRLSAAVGRSTMTLWTGQICGRICAHSMSRRARGHDWAEGFRARIDGGRLGFEAVSLYGSIITMKYGWRYIGTGRHTWGEHRGYTSGHDQVGCAWCCSKRTS